MLVKDIRPGQSGSDPYNLTNVSGTLFFTANNGVSGKELWKSNGTAAGTVLVKDIRPGSAGSNPYFLTNVNGILFFQANNGVSGAELWKSNGTAAGTKLVVNIKPGSLASYPSDLANVNGTLFFHAFDGVHGTEPWVLDPASVSVPVTASVPMAVSVASAVSVPAAVALDPSPAAFAGVASGFLPDTGSAGLRLPTVSGQHLSALESGDTAARWRSASRRLAISGERHYQIGSRSPANLHPRSQLDGSVVSWSLEPANDPLAPF